MLLTGATYGGGHSSANYAIPSDVLSCGGKNMTSGGYGFASTLGQPSAIGISISGSYTNSAGYWPAVFSAAGGQAVTHMLSIAVDPVAAGSVAAFGIDCPADCTDTYDEGAQVILTALPAAGYLFDRWEGDLTSSDNPLTLVLNADMALRAVFIQGASDEPTTSTEIPTSVTESSAMLKGAVNPNGLDTSYFFEYGTTGCLGFSTDAVLLAAAYNNTSVDNEITGLSDNTTYYFRVVASNSQGTTFGNILSFTTQNAGVGSPPLKPDLTLPLDNTEDIPLMPTFFTGSFSDPDINDTHRQTEWQISEFCDFTSAVFEKISPTNLTQLTAPHLDLLPGTTYYWRVRYYDKQLNHSDWSGEREFTTQVDTNDQNSNGVPDNLENETVDLDNDGLPDFQQDHITTINTVIGNCQVGISIANEPNVEKIEAINSIDHKTTSALVRPYDMPIGLVAFRLLLKSLNATVHVSIYFCRPMPEEMTWYNYNSVDGWSNYSEYATFSPDRKSLVLELTDGGKGDADGVANGIIVDPCGSGIASFLEGLVFDGQTSKKIGNAKILIDDVVVNSFEDGHYLTMLLPGEYQMIALAQGYETLFDTLVIPEGFTVTKNLALTPVEGNTEPTAFITSPASNMTINAGESVVFRCAVVNGNEPLAYAWNFGGGAPNSNQEYPGSIIFQNAGIFAVTLTVNDTDGDTSSDTVMITVLEPPNDGNGGGGGSSSGGGGGGGGCFVSMLTKKVIDSYSGFLLLFLLGIVGLYHNFRK